VITLAFGLRPLSPSLIAKIITCATHYDLSMRDFQISRTSQALYITIIAKNRLPVFRTDKVKLIVCEALKEARNSAEFLIFAYVIMPDHLHLVTDESKPSSEILRYLKGTTSRRVIDYLKNNNFVSSLAKLRHQEWRRKHTHSLWQQEKNVFSIYSESLFMQKVNYIHLNPVRANLVEKATDYPWSSARIWQRQSMGDEPLQVDIDRIKWRA
jgi:putative transposase